MYTNDNIETLTPEEFAEKYLPVLEQRDAANSEPTPTCHSDDVLYLQKRGCDFFQSDVSTRESDLGNYRLFLEFIDRDGVRVCGDVLRGAVRRYSPKGKEQIVTENGLYCDFQYESHKGCYCYNVPEHDELRYTRADVLKLVNSISAVQYARIEFTDELPGEVQRYPEEVLELERAYLAREHAAMLSECEALIRENFVRWMIGALRSTLRELTPEEYRRMTLIAFDCMVEKYGVIKTSMHELRSPAAMAALNMATHFFKEQHYVDPYGDTAFLLQLHARSPYYVGRFLTAAHAMNPDAH